MARDFGFRAEAGLGSFTWTGVTHFSIQISTIRTAAATGGVYKTIGANPLQPQKWKNERKEG